MCHSITTIPRILPRNVRLVPGKMSRNSNTTRETLINRLLASLVESPFDQGREFWPDGCISEMVTPETITDEMDELNGQTPSSALVDFIILESRKIFAIVLCCSLARRDLFHAMSDFMRLNFNDSKLPIVGNEAKRIFRSSNGAYQHPWGPLAVKSFENYQWNALAPTFRQRSQELALQKGHILPFTWSSHRGTSGMFGEVYEVAIHPAHRFQVRLSRFLQLYTLATC